MTQKSFTQQIAEITKAEKVEIVLQAAGHSRYDVFITINGQRTNLATFHLLAFPGCCGACISFACSVSTLWRNKGLGQLLNKMRIQAAYNAGYTLLVCTDKTANTHQVKLLTANGWVKSAEFRNKRTNNMVGLFTVMVKDTGIPIGEGACPLNYAGQP